MGRIARIFILLARAAGYAFGLLVIVVAVWLAANRLLDEQPSLQAKALLATDDAIPDTRNAAVGILGLSAPRNSDFLRHGAQIKTLLAANAPHPQIREMVRGPQSLRATVKGEQVMCWADPDWPGWSSFTSCLPFEKAPAVLAENKELLARFKTLYTLGEYAAPQIYYDDAYLLLVRLALAEIHLELRYGKHESAYRKWQQQLAFIRRNLHGTDTWVGKAVGLVALGLTLPVLDNLLLAEPQIAKGHSAELYEVLRPQGIAAFGPEGLVRAEFQLFARALDQPPVDIPEYGTDRLHWLAYHLGQKNRLLNRYASLAPEYASALHLPWNDAPKEFARLREEYSSPTGRDLLVDPFGSLFMAQYLEGQLKAFEMLRQMHIVDARLRLATVLVRLLEENVRDADIPRFLATAGPRLVDPFTGSPPRWDPKDRKIFFTDPTEKCIVISWFRVREAGRQRRPASSVVNTNAC